MPVCAYETCAKILSTYLNQKTMCFLDKSEARMIVSKWFIKISANKGLKGLPIVRPIFCCRKKIRNIALKNKIIIDEAYFKYKIYTFLGQNWIYLTNH